MPRRLTRMADSTVPHGMGFLGCFLQRWDVLMHSCDYCNCKSRNIDLTSVQLDYGIDGQKFEGAQHEGANGTRIVYELNPQETLKKISGFYGAHQSWVIIKSLTFHTNQPKIGPHGPEQGAYFQTNKEEGKITGIHGFGSRAFVNSIGVYMLKLRTFKPGGRVD